MSSEQGSSSGAAERPIGYLEKPMSYWQRLPHRSDTGGVSPMMIEGREKYEVERMRGMTPERRAWRKQFLEDQILSPREPVYVHELYMDTHNVFRRGLNWPFNQIKKLLLPLVGEKWAERARLSFKTHFVIISFAYLATYLVMYHPAKWTAMYPGIGIMMRKPMIYPGEAHYPFVSTMELDDYGTRGFKQSIFYKTEEEIKAQEANKKTA